MERKLKERLVGAALLVLIGVLVIPLFLGGPGTEPPQERQSIALPAADDDATPTRTIRLEQSREQPIAPPLPDGSGAGESPPPAAMTGQLPQDEARADPPPSPDAAPVQSTPPAPQQTPDAGSTGEADPPPGAPAAESQAAQQPSGDPEGSAAAGEAADEPAPDAAAGAGWVVQVGSFSSRENADRLADELREQRFQSFVTRYEGGGTVLHRVRIGPASERDEAARLAERLVDEGYAAAQPVPEQ